MKLLVFGFGYSAAALAENLSPEWEVFGTTRSEPGRVRAAGATPLRWDADAAEIAERAREADALLASAAPAEGHDPVLARFGEAISQSKARWIGYLSSTNVYGDLGGAWVDESAPVAPTTPRAKARRRAEIEWQELAAAHGLPLHIFRLAGIYGPGRGPIEKLRSGTARRIIKPNQIFSRIHRDDIGGALAASIARPEPGAIYNLGDDRPAAPEEVMVHAAGLLGIAPPPAEPFESAQMSPMARSFYADSKRVSNRALCKKLGYKLRYPDYDSGLRAILAAERETPSHPPDRS
ncbi:MAG: SDR family oxidoreductase [Paracoccus sp. (in: a-proteobacteria)]|nr:SDR family oxidoreductase [Paracoccus sp. (in: a-proteobacteria)]